MSVAYDGADGDVSTVSAVDTEAIPDVYSTADAADVAVEISSERLREDGIDHNEREAVEDVEAATASSTSTVTVKLPRKPSLSSDNNTVDVKIEQHNNNYMDSESSWISYENEFDECFPAVCKLYAKITSLMDAFGATVLSVEIPENARDEWREVVSLDCADIIGPHDCDDDEQVDDSQVSGSSSDLYERDVHAADLANKQNSFYGEENVEARSAPSHGVSRSIIHSSEIVDERDAACGSNDQSEHSYSRNETTQSYREESDDETYFASASEAPSSDDDIDNLTRCSDDYRPYGAKFCLERSNEISKTSEDGELEAEKKDDKLYAASCDKDGGFRKANLEDAFGQIKISSPDNDDKDSAKGLFDINCSPFISTRKKKKSSSNAPKVIGSTYEFEKATRVEASNLLANESSPNISSCQNISAASCNTRSADKMQSESQIASSSDDLSSVRCGSSMSSSSVAVNLLQSFHQSFADDINSNEESKTKATSPGKEFNGSSHSGANIPIGTLSRCENSFASATTAHNDSCLAGMSAFVTLHDLPSDRSLSDKEIASNAFRRRRIIEESSCSSSSSIVDLLQSFQQNSESSNTDLHTSENSKIDLANDFDGLAIRSMDSAEGTPRRRSADGFISENSVCLDAKVDSDVLNDESSTASTVKLPRQLHSSMKEVISLEESSNDSWIGSSASVLSESASLEGPIECFSNPSLDEVESDNADDIANSSKCTCIGWHFDESTNEYTIDKERTKDMFPVPVRPKHASERMDTHSIPNIRLPGALFSRLYEHQKVGVQWMASLHAANVGGILGDDMGMGKTYQTLTFLGGLMRNDIIRCALFICPVSCIQNWVSEASLILRKCVSGINIIPLTSNIQAQRRKQLLFSGLSKQKKRPCFVVASYGLAGKVDNLTCFDNCGNKFEWDYVILDEGHKIKNSSAQTTKGCHLLCGKRTHRLLLTGTPIQNKLTELWTLFDWATAGCVLGKLTWFKNQFSDPIEQGRHQGVDEHTLRIANKASDELQALLKPHFLQRLKKGIFRNKLTSKQEIVVWTHISTKQREMYEKYLLSKNSQINCILRGEKASALEEISWLKKLCGHPLLCEGVTNFNVYSRESLLNESSKLSMLVDLIENLLALGHRVLIFSQSTRMLDIISNVLNFTKFARIDGSTKGPDRQKIVDNFNNGTSTGVMLLSTKAAGLGINLTTADRAVIYDPSWNPAEDAQAVDRCYRIGQKKDVIVYRFIASGTVEEKMYEKQVFKDGIKNQVLVNGYSSARHFTKNDLKKMFTLAPKGECVMLEKFGHNVRPSKESAELVSHNHVVGLSSHDEVYSNGNESEKSVNSPIQIQTGLVNLSRSQAANSYCDQENHVGNNLKGTDGIILQPQKVGKSARVIGNNPVVDIVPLSNRKLNSKY